MGRIEIVQALPAHVPYLAENMRAGDVREVESFSGSTPEKALRRGLDRSTACLTVLTLDKIPLVMFGVASLSAITRTGIPWLLGTDAALQYRREFMREGRRYVDAMLDVYPNLVNYVHEDNRASIVWLRRLGFTLDEAVPTGVKRELFHKFYITR